MKLLNLITASMNSRTAIRIMNDSDPNIFSGLVGILSNFPQDIYDDNVGRGSKRWWKVWEKNYDPYAVESAIVGYILGNDFNMLAKHLKNFTNSKNIIDGLIDMSFTINNQQDCLKMLEMCKKMLLVIKKYGNQFEKDKELIKKMSNRAKNAISHFSSNQKFDGLEKSEICKNDINDIASALDDMIDELEGIDYKQYTEENGYAEMQINNVIEICNESMKNYQNQNTSKENNKENTDHAEAQDMEKVIKIYNIFLELADDSNNDSMVGKLINPIDRTFARIFTETFPELESNPQLCREFVKGIITDSGCYKSILDILQGCVNENDPTEAKKIFKFWKKKYRPILLDEWNCNSMQKYIGRMKAYLSTQDKEHLFDSNAIQVTLKLKIDIAVDELMMKK